MIALMKEFTGLEDKFISWYSSFEISINKDLIEWLPDYGSYLNYMNENMFDLETIFKKDYIAYRFHGSTSLKKVLPVMASHLSYSEL